MLEYTQTQPHEMHMYFRLCVTRICLCVSKKKKISVRVPGEESIQWFNCCEESFIKEWIAHESLVSIRRSVLLFEFLHRSCRTPEVSLQSPSDSGHIPIFLHDRGKISYVTVIICTPWVICCLWCLMWLRSILWIGDSFRNFHQIYLPLPNFRANLYRGS